MIHLPAVNQYSNWTTLYNGQAVNHGVQMVRKVLFYTSKSEMSRQRQQKCRRLSFPPPRAAVLSSSTCCYHDICMSNVSEAVPDGCFVTRDNPDPVCLKIPVKSQPG